MANETVLEIIIEAGGIDGVELEVQKLEKVQIERMGRKVVKLTGRFLGDDEEAYKDHHALSELIVNDLFSTLHPRVQAFQSMNFLPDERVQDPTDEQITENHKLIYDHAQEIKQVLLDLHEQHGFSRINAQNIFAIPVHFQLGVGVRLFLDEINKESVQVVNECHLHDPFFKMSRRHIYGFWPGGKKDIEGGSQFDETNQLLKDIYPGNHQRDTVYYNINSLDADLVAQKTGQDRDQITLLPNVMDFANKPVLEQDDFAKSLRSKLGLDESSFVILQPTRVVPRKNIEDAIRATAFLSEHFDAHLVIYGEIDANDLDARSYGEKLEALIEHFNLQPRVHFAGDVIKSERNEEEGVFSLRDAYLMADAVSYPSSLEGFGNAFLESVYFHKPLLLVYRYDVMDSDIQDDNEPFIGVFYKKDSLEDELTAQVKGQLLAYTQKIRAKDHQIARDVEHNYSVAERRFSFEVLHERLEEISRQAQELES